MVACENFIFQVQSEFPVKCITKTFLIDTIIKLFVDQSEVSALHIECNDPLRSTRVNLCDFTLTLL